MLTITIILKSTDHPIVLTYKNHASAERAADAPDSKGAMRVSDDFGKTAAYAYDDVAAVETTDLDAAIEGMVRRAAWRVRARNAMVMHFEQQPDLKPHIGSEAIEEMFEGGPR